MAVIELGPQEGPQTKILKTPADIAIYGGAAGGGKTFALILEALRNLNTENFEALVFRRTTKQITNPGGLWDESEKIMPLCGARPIETKLKWECPNGFALRFAHMEYEKNKYDWQGSQIPLIGFDELTHFTWGQFVYMLSRNRSMTGIKGYVRATCNPDADSWVREFIDWWIDEETGLPIPERDGVIRFFVNVNDELHWADTEEELIEEFGPDSFPKSVTFIAANVYDNKILLEKDPAYLANLNALDRVERSRLKDGNWNVRAGSGMYFKESDFEIIEAAPTVVKRIRYWDRAGTKEITGKDKEAKKNNPDWTVGVDMGVTRGGEYIIFNVERFRESPLKMHQRIKNIASQDGHSTVVGIEEDPGQAGKVESAYLVKLLAGYNVRVFPVSKDKVTRAQGYSAQAEAGNVKLVRGKWNKVFIQEHVNFPPESSDGKDDQVDASSGAFNYLTGDKVGEWRDTMNKGKKSSSTFASGLSRRKSTIDW